jgi:alpha-tubulin suppressor-like RCC1 family protein
VGDGTGGSRNGQRDTPVPVVGLDSVAAVQSGWSFSLALKRDGTVWAWGANGYGQLGLGVTGGLWPRPTQIPGLTDVVKISTDDMHSLALKRDGTVWAWGGWNRHGELGNGTTSPPQATVGFPNPTQVVGLTGVVDISAGQEHSVAVKADGSIWSWGDNAVGQLGINDLSVTASPVPRQSADLPDPWDPSPDAVRVEAGGNTTFAVRRDGTVLGFGQCRYNSYSGSMLLRDPSGCPLPGYGYSVDPRPELQWYLQKYADPYAPIQMALLDHLTDLSVGHGDVIVIRKP